MRCTFALLLTTLGSAQPLARRLKAVNLGLGAPAAQGELLGLCPRSNGTDSQPCWVYPLADWEPEGAGPLTGSVAW